MAKGTLEDYRRHEMSEVDRDAMEALVDKYDLPTVVDNLARIAALKSEHVAVNWQDARLAKVWDRAAGILDATAERLRKL